MVAYQMAHQQRVILVLLSLTALLCYVTFYTSNTHNLIASRPGRSSADEPLLFGVNVYGWIRGEFGGGRTARSVINNLKAVGVNLTAVEISGADLQSTTNMAIEEQGFTLFPRRDFAFDLFVINAANTLTTLLDPSNDIFDDNHRYRIGLWHWETSQLPLLQGSYGKFYNEIWVPTQFVADAILATESFPVHDVRVVVLPYGYETLPSPITSPVDLRQKRRYRQQLPHVLRRITWQSRPKDSVLVSSHAEETLQYWADTEEDVLLFLVIFDFNSDYNRKNIIATVRAFLKAFPSDSGSPGGVQGSRVGLVMKAINAHSQIDDFNRLHWLLEEGGGRQEGISHDRRVVLVNGLCSEQDLQILRKASSCFVSLHRAEGLGLNLMEAALVGVPVVASAFSGSEQFMAPLYGDRAPELRIPTKIVQVNREFGPYTTDMHWGEPCEEAAINALRLVYSYSEYYSSLAVGPIREHALSMMSPESTGGAMRARLRLLHDCMALVQQQQQKLRHQHKHQHQHRQYTTDEVNGVDVCLTRVLGRRRQVSQQEEDQGSNASSLVRQQPLPRQML